MTDNYNRHDSQIISPCIDAADLFIEKAFRQFKDQFIDQVNLFRVLMEKSVENVSDDDSRRPGERLCAGWARIDTWLDQQKEWADFNAYPELRAMVDKECRKQFDDMINALPKALEIHWEPDFLMPLADDSMGVRLFKRIKRVKRQLGIWQLACTNVFRSEKKNMADDSHVLFLQNFMRLHILIPYCDFLSEFMDRVMDLISGHSKAMHDLSCVYTEAFLGLEKDKERWPKDIHDTVQSLVEAGGHGRVDTENVSETLDTLWKESREGLNKVKSSLGKTWAFAYHFSGTVVMPHARYGRTRFQKLHGKQIKNFTQNQELWKRHFEGEGRDWSHDIALRRIQVQVALKTFETVGSVSDKINGQIVPQCSHAIEILMKTKERLASMENAGEWLLKKNMIRESRSLVQNFRKELLPAIANKVLGSGISQDLNAIIRFASDKASHLADTHKVFKKRDTHIPPRSELAEIPIRELFNEEFLIGLQSVLDAFQQNFRIRLDDTVNGMSDIRQIVEFNLETSFNLLDKEDYTDEAYQMVIEGIDRSINQLQTLMDQIMGLPQGISTDLGGIAYQWISQVQIILDNEKLIALKLKLAKAKAKGRLKKIIGQLSVRLKNRVTALNVHLSKTYGQVHEKYLETRSYLGLSLPDEGVQIQFSQFLLDTKKKLNALPYVYQQLFQIEPLTDDRLFYGRETELETMKTDMANLEKTGGVLFAMVGEKGSGKTTLINLFSETLPKTFSIHTLDVKTTLHDVGELLHVFSPIRPDEPFSTLEDLDNFLISNRNKHVIVFENIQNLFIKSMDGFDLLESFLGLLNSTREHAVWICSCTLYSWEYLEKTLSISNVFNRIITLKPFGGNEIESMVFARHRITGYQLKFIVPKKIRFSRAYRKLSSEKERQAFLRKIFFVQIQSVASGNISVAILFWLRSIETIREHELFLSSQVDLNVKFFSLLNTEDLFTLGAIVHHDSLTIQDHAVIFRQPIQKSLLVLQNLGQMGILQYTDHVYRIHPFLYRHVVRSLKLQNILH